MTRAAGHVVFWIFRILLVAKIRNGEAFVAKLRSYPRSGVLSSAMQPLRMTRSSSSSTTEESRVAPVTPSSNYDDKNESNGAMTLNPTVAPLVKRDYETFLWKHNLQSYNINYRVEGPVDAPPILLIHGFGANVNHFRFQFRKLSTDYRVYAVDLLGFGGSDKPKTEDYSIQLWVDLLKDFVQTMHQDKEWVVAGNSIGGLCSLCVAEQLPLLVKGVVLFNCAGGMSGFRYEDVPMYLRPLLWVIQKVVLGPKLGGRFFANFKTRANVESILRQQGVYGDKTNVDDELFEILLGPSEDDGAQEVFLRVMAGPPGPKPEDVLPGVKCPILALWGDSDPWTPLDRGAHPGNSFGDYTEDYKLVVLPGVAHCPHDECPDQIHSYMIPWMKEL